MPKEMEALSHAQRYLVPEELHVDNSLTYKKVRKHVCMLVFSYET